MLALPSRQTTDAPRISSSARSHTTMLLDKFSSSYSPRTRDYACWFPPRPGVHMTPLPATQGAGIDRQCRLRTFPPLVPRARDAGCTFTACRLTTYEASA
jgi:hypothetical protein